MTRPTLPRLVPAAAAATALLVPASAATAAPRPAIAPPPSIVAQVPGLPFAKGKQARRTYVGVAGRSFLALVVHGDRLVAYLCDGRRSSDWFGAPVRRGRFGVRSAKGTVLRGVVGRTIEGRVRIRGGRAIEFTAVRARGAAGLYAGPDTRLDGAYRYRWIRIGNSVRGVSEDGTGSVKNGVAVTEPGFVGPTTTSTGTGSGVDVVDYSDLTCAQLQAEADRLRAQAGELEKKTKTKWVKAQLGLLYETIMRLMDEGVGRSPRCDV